MRSSSGPSITVPHDSRLLALDLLRATETAALNCISWRGKGNKEAADAAACDAIRGMFKRTAMRGEIVIGEGIKDESPGLLAGERVGTWEAGTPRLDIAVDPLDGTTNLSRGLPNALCCIAAALRSEDDTPVLQSIPAFYMKKLAYPPLVRDAWVADPALPLNIDAPLSEVIALTARVLGKNIRDVVVMVFDRPRNAHLVAEVRSLGASLRMITDGDISAALAPALSNQGVDLYVGIGGAPEGILAAAGLRCLGGGMQAKIWPRDDAERQSLIECGWSDRFDKIYRSRDLVRGDDVLFVATGVSDSPLLRGVRAKGSTLISHSVVMHQRTGSVRFVRTRHDVSKRPIYVRSATVSPMVAAVKNEMVADPSHRRISAAHRSLTDRQELAKRPSALLLFGAPGSGKSTIGRALATLPCFSHCSSGNLIREAIASVDGKSSFATKVACGALLSDAEVFELFDDFIAKYRLQQWSEEQQLVIDGIPRCRTQVNLLDQRVEVRGVYYLDCGDPKRLVARLCGRFASSGRLDDANERIILERLQLFHDDTLPLLHEYPRALVHRVDATQAPAMVLRDILNGLGMPAAARDPQGVC
ncbi:MAG TPA: nucleoside monophosphate kinase [Lacipirellulaceae bacterium]|nr:nucleoside monophosphate kinase [Lacipirellulaceae bacterium]HMP07183.1 nucleoside monophosphate kinase [Lacipirellulaceae bacterium]